MPAFVVHVLVAAVLLVVVTGAVRGATSGDRLRRLLAADPARLIPYYVAAIAYSWMFATATPGLVVASTELTPAEAGWARPGGDGLDYLLAAVLVLVIVAGGVRARRRMLRGRPVAGREATAMLVPRTGPQRRLAAGFAITAGCTEEMLYRGALIGVGTQVYGLPLAVAAAASLVLFVAGHTYQGPRALVGVAAVGVLLTALYLMSGSLLLPVVVHAVQNLVALLLVPAEPVAPRTPAPPAEPARPEPPVVRSRVRPATIDRPR